MRVYRGGSGRVWCAVAVACLVGLTAASMPAIAAAPGKTLKDGVFSAAQAKRGAGLFKDRCASCHAANLSGGDGPPLTGGDFLANWDKMPVSDLVAKITETMPSDKPGTLTRQQAIDLVSFILQTNKFPAGTADLAADATVLKTISITK